MDREVVKKTVQKHKPKLTEDQLNKKKEKDGRGSQKKKNKDCPSLLKIVPKLVYENKKLLKSTGTVIREDLTQSKLKLLKDAINKLERNGRAWTVNSTIFCKYNGEQTIVKIEEPSDIAKL
nr:unnamed protein product [Callosobruchus analis]